MNKLYILVLLLTTVSCTPKTSVDTDVVRANTLHLDQINDDADIVSVFKTVTNSNILTVSDSRLLRFYDVPVSSVSCARNRNLLLTNLTITLLKDSEIEDGEKIKSKLTASYGQAEIEERDSTTFLWNKDKKRYVLKMVEKGYSNRSTLDIYFNNADKYNYH